MNIYANITQRQLALRQASFAALLLGILTGVSAAVAQPLERPLALSPSEGPPLVGAEYIDVLAGLWRHINDPIGCTDVDGKGSVRVGRFDFDQEGKVVSGTGPARLGFYEALCEVSDVSDVNGRLEMNADCINEGEPAIGPASIEVLDFETIRIQTPTISSTFKACYAEQLDGIAALTDRGPTTPPTTLAQIASTPESDVVPLRTEPLAADARPNLDPQRNALAMVIADYCQPDFYETGHWGNGDWDPGFYDRYKQQLLVRYVSNCDEFWKAEYQPFTFIDEVLANNPGLFPVGRSALSAEHALVAGYYLRVANVASQNQCDLSSDRSVPPTLVPSLNAVLNAATVGDQLTVALGYGLAKLLGEQRSIFDAAPPTCGSGVLVLDGLLTMAYNSGLVALPYKSAN